jgi:hypothetical protein
MRRGNVHVQRNVEEAYFKLLVVSFTGWGMRHKNLSPYKYE